MGFGFWLGEYATDILTEYGSCFSRWTPQKRVLRRVFTRMPNNCFESSLLQLNPILSGPNAFLGNPDLSPRKKLRTIQVSDASKPQRGL